MDRYSLDFENVTLDVLNKNKSSKAQKYLKLVNGVSGKFESGKVTAVMGPSGSCKTSLITLLIGRVDPSTKTSGTVLFKGVERNPKEWLTQHAFLEQDDCIVPGQTVREFITFSVACRANYKAEKLEEVVENVMADLFITKIADVSLTVISGGERKRVMIAVEFAIQADVLILDEPTSGLDSHLALELIDLLKRYAVEKNKIVITTIHQPGSGLFNMIDDLMFLYKGIVMYSGSIDKIDTFFDENNFKIAHSLSKAEFLFELFVDRSSFADINAHKPIIQRLYNDKLERAMKVNYKISQKNDFHVDLSFSFKHIWLIYKRIAIFDFRRMKGFGVYFSQILASIFIWFYSYINIATIINLLFVIFHDYLTGKTGYNPATSDANNRAVVLDALKAFRVKYLYHFDDVFTKFLPESFSITEKVSQIMMEILYFRMISIIDFCTLYMKTSALVDMTHIARESVKGTYSMISFYLAVVAIEITHVLVRCGLFVAVLSSFGMSKGLTLFNIVYMIAGSIILKLFDIFTSIGLGNGILASIFSFVKVLVLMFSMPEFMTLIVQWLSNGMIVLKVLQYFKFLSFFCGRIFLNSFMSVKLIKRASSFIPDLKYKNDNMAEAIIDLKRTSEEEVIIFKIFGLCYDFVPVIENKLKKVVDGEYKLWLYNSKYSDYLDLVFLAISIGLVVSLSIRILLTNYAPGIRLRLGK